MCGSLSFHSSLRHTQRCRDRLQTRVLQLLPYVMDRPWSTRRLAYQRPSRQIAARTTDADSARRQFSHAIRRGQVVARTGSSVDRLVSLFTTLSLSAHASLLRLHRDALGCLFDFLLLSDLAVLLSCCHHWQARDMELAGYPHRRRPQATARVMDWKPGHPLWHSRSPLRHLITSVAVGATVP